MNTGSVSLGNTYKGIRVQSKYYNLYYAVHCTNEHELYDMTVSTPRAILFCTQLLTYPTYLG